jgi:thioredoxin 1
MQRGNTMIIGIVIVAIALIGGAIIFGGNNSGTENRNINNKTRSNDSSQIDDVSDEVGNFEEQSANGGGEYVEFSEGVLEEHADKRRVLYFYASWCPTCRPLDADLSATDRIPEDVVIIRVNYKDNDTDQAEDDLADEYGVTYQHTFVEIDGDGAVVQKWNGGQIDSVISRIE